MPPQRHREGLPQGPVLFADNGPRSLLSDYLTRAQAAKELGVTPRVLSEWMNEPGGIPHLKLGRRFGLLLVLKTPS
jgi:hypothetical protein